MTLDYTLTQHAQEYAEELALNDTGLVHCFDVEGCDFDGAGENLASAEGYTKVEANATVMWYNEIWDYNFCTTGTVDRHRPGHEGRAIGHFTQVVWKSSTLLGVGYARTSDRFKVYVVARYKFHGNVIGLYDNNVRRPAYILDKFQDNCFGINGGLSEWMGPGSCSRSCGGGVTFFTRICTNPKPSLNGRDCEGVTKILIPEWCNTHVCSGDLSHRDLQCLARGEAADAHNFRGIRDCRLHCRISATHFLLVGNVDDGTHCDSHSGACVSGVCHDMPDYVVGTQSPTTMTETTSEVIGTTTKQPETTTTRPTSRPTASPTPRTRKLVTGSFREILLKRFERLVTIRSGATDIVIYNYTPRNARLSVRFQKWKKKPKTYKEKYGLEMLPFAEQMGRGNKSIMPMIAIQGPIRPGFKVIVYIRRRRKRRCSISWEYWAQN